MIIVIVISEAHVCMRRPPTLVGLGRVMQRSAPSERVTGATEPVTDKRTIGATVFSGDLGEEERRRKETCFGMVARASHVKIPEWISQAISCISPLVLRS